MPAISDSAVVLRRLDYSETSQVIVFFARDHGKVRAIGKGVKRSTKTRFAVGIDLLDVGRLVFSTKQERSSTLANIIEWKQTRTLSGLREKLFRLHAAQYAAEITAALTEDWDPHSALYDGMVDTLCALAEAPEPLAPTVRLQRTLLRSIGSWPRFDRCVTCGRDRDLRHFSSHEGGMICRHCEPQRIEKREVSPTTVAVVRAESSTQPHVGAFGLLNYHITHLMGREPLLAAKLASPLERRLVE